MVISCPKLRHVKNEKNLGNLGLTTDVAAILYLVIRTTLRVSNREFKLGTFKGGQVNEKTKQRYHSGTLYPQRVMCASTSRCLHHSIRTGAVPQSPRHQRKRC